MVFVARNYSYFPGVCCHLRIAQAAKMSLAVDQGGELCLHCGDLAGYPGRHSVGE
jgi:hypothetical protein